MIKYLFDKNIIIYTYAGLCGLGLIMRLIVNLVYKHLVKESDNLGETKNKMLKHMKMKFETCYRLKIGVNNVDTFVDKNVLQYRFCGVLLSTWDNFCGQVLFLNLLAVPILATFGVFYKCGQDRILFSGAVGILTSAVLMLVDKSINLSGKKRMLRLNLLDYLENFCKVRLEQEAIHPELIEQHRREFMQVAEANKQISATAVAADKKEEPKDELNRRREARIKKEEDRKLAAVKRIEEQQKVEEARKEEEKRRLEERRQVAARRREEERQKLEEEREALEARRAELKKKAMEKQQSNDLKQQKEQENNQIVHSFKAESKSNEELKAKEKLEANEEFKAKEELKANEELKPNEDKTDMQLLIKGLEEIAVEKERAELAEAEKEKLGKEKVEKPENVKQQKVTSTKAKSQGVSLQEEKLIEDVLKEFFA